MNGASAQAWTADGDGACLPTTTIRDTSRKLSMPDTAPWCSHSTLRGSGVLYFQRGGTEQ